jgi:hypothetical protein
MSEGDTLLMPPPALPVVMAPTPAVMPPPAAVKGPPPAVTAPPQEANGQHVEQNASTVPDRKTKKKNKKKEKRKEKRQSQAVERKQQEDKLSVDPIHRARLEYEERLQQEQEARERQQVELKRLQWEQREQEILAEIERKKQEEELKRLEQEEKKRQEAEEREVGLVFVCKYPLSCLCDCFYLCLHIYTYFLQLILLNFRDGSNFALHNKQKQSQMVGLLPVQEVQPEDQHPTWRLRQRRHLELKRYEA